MILEGRLRSHCFGLVEIKRPSLSYNDSCFCGYRPGLRHVHDEIIDSTVVFMHRTVFDFLSARGSAEFEDRMESREIFDASVVLSCISLRLAGLTLNHPKGASHVRDVLAHAASTSIDRCTQVESILTKLQELLVGRSTPAVETLGNVHIYGMVDERTMSDIKASKLYLPLFLAVEMGITGLLQLYECMGRGKLSDLSLHIPLLGRTLEKPLTKDTIRGIYEVARRHTKLDTDMVRYLIARGCSPDERFIDWGGRETTPWDQLLNAYLNTKASSASKAAISSTIDLFLEGGADPDHGAMLFHEVQKAAKIDIPLERQMNRMKGGGIKDKTSRDLCGHFLQKIAVHEAKLSLDASGMPIQENGKILERFSIHKRRQIPADELEASAIPKPAQTRPKQI